MKMSPEERRAQELRDVIGNLGKSSAPKVRVSFTSQNSQGISEVDLMRLKREVLEEVEKRREVQVSDKITAAVVDKIRKDKMFDVSDLRNYQSFVYAKTKYGVHEMMHGGSNESSDETNSVTLFTQTQAVTVANTTNETTMFGSGVGSETLSANYLEVGKTIRVTARGIHSTLNSSQTATFLLKIGGTTVATSSSFTISQALTNASFEIEALVTCYSTGALGTVWGQGMYVRSGSQTRSIASTAASTVDTTGALAVDLTIAWGAADPANTIKTTNLVIEGLN